MKCGAIRCGQKNPQQLIEYGIKQMGMIFPSTRKAPRVGSREKDAPRDDNKISDAAIAYIYIKVVTMSYIKLVTMSYI